MPTFKSKNFKKLSSDPNLESLDFKHEEFLSDFNTNEKEKIPNLYKKREDLLNKYNSTDILEEKLDLKDTIKNIDQEIKSLKTSKKQYLLNNSEHIFNYFENKKKISAGISNTKRLDNFFNIKNNNEELDIGKTDQSLKHYFTNIDSNYLDINNYIHPTDICQSCKKGELIPIDHEGILVCNNCSRNIRFLIENEKPTYKEPPKEVCFYAYKRINHFREILAQFQAKETTLIPDEIIENIRQQIKKERLDITTMTNKRTKDVLKKLKYNKYYEHIPFIKDKLGVKPPIMTPELEEILCNLFIDIQAPYAKYCPEDRVNFLNYYYTIYKLCELLEQNQFLPYFPMLKDREKRIEQDEIWKKICEELEWKFIPTI
tara:strand:+ start:5026 stop:6144 length:1119 start_codon:yes stop_codon:yes gene_type:complete